MRDEPCAMGVDMGMALHVVILQPIDGEGDVEKQQLVHLAVCRDFSDLDAPMARFRVDRCVKTGENHFSFAFTYAWMAASRLTRFRGRLWL